MIFVCKNRGLRAAFLNFQNIIVVIFCLFFFRSEISAANPTPTCPVPPLLEIELTLEGFSAYLKKYKEQVRTVDQVISCLPLEMRGTFSLLHYTGSTQNASWNYPRAVLVSPNARFSLAFSCDPDALEDSERIELIHTHPESGRNNFAEIRIGDLARKKGHENLDLNPEACVRCHGTGEAARHIWDPYPYWPCAFHGGDEGTPRPVEGKPTVEEIINSGKGCYRQLVDKSGMDGAFMTSYALNYIHFEKLLKRMQKNPAFKDYRYALGVAARYYLPDCKDPKGAPIIGENLFAGKALERFREFRKKFRANHDAFLKRRQALIPSARPWPELFSDGVGGEIIEQEAIFFFVALELGIPESEQSIAYDRLGPTTVSLIGALWPKLVEPFLSEPINCQEDTKKSRQIFSQNIASTVDTVNELSTALVQMNKIQRACDLIAANDLSGIIQAKPQEHAPKNCTVPEKLIAATQNILERHQCAACHSMEHTEARAPAIPLANLATAKEFLVHQKARSGRPMLDEILIRVQQEPSAPGFMPPVGTKTSPNQLEIAILKDFAQALKKCP